MVVCISISPLLKLDQEAEYIYQELHLQREAELVAGRTHFHSPSATNVALVSIVVSGLAARPASG